MSPDPPAGQGTIKLIGLVGYSTAIARGPKDINMLKVIINAIKIFFVWCIFLSCV
jgi:hypothetical protein